MTTLLLLALLAQSADAAVACRHVSRGARELNPMLPQSCAGIIGIKAAAFGLVALSPHKRVGFGVLAVGGGIGVGVSIALRGGP